MGRAGPLTPGYGLVFSYSILPALYARHDFLSPAQVATRPLGRGLQMRPSTCHTEGMPPFVRRLVPWFSDYMFFDIPLGFVCIQPLRALGPRGRRVFDPCLM